MSTISAIYGARKQLGLDDDTARDVYQSEVGKRSLRDMTPREQVLVLQRLRRDTHFRGVAMGGPYARKLQALWLDGWNLGLVRNNTDAALLTFVERQTGLQAVRFLRDAADARKAVEALKKWIARAGVDWGEHATPADAVIEAQGRLLGLDAGAGDDATIEALAWGAWRLGELQPGEHIRVMKCLGAAIRRNKAD